MDLLSTLARTTPLLALALLACQDTRYYRVIDDIEHPERSLPDAFDEAAAAFDVPVDLLVALADTESGLQVLDAHEEFEGQPRRFGIMGLPARHLAEAAALAGVDEHEASTVRDANVLAAAALLDAWADGIDRDELGAWAPVVARYGDLEMEEALAHYVHDEVYARLQRGIELEDLVVPPWGGQAAYPSPQRSSAGLADRDYARWRPSPNHSARPAGSAGDPSMVVIHSCEGAYTGCWSWLTNPSSGVSAHYVVNADGAEISQLVDEDRKAWHVGARYDCDLNGDTECGRNGRSTNDFTIGIEHAGYANQSTWSLGLLAASAQLVCDITRDHGIPRDVYHVVAHGTLQPYNRIDPGPNWPWASYLADVRARCAEEERVTPADPGTSSGSTAPVAPPEQEAPPPASPPVGDVIVIDSNNGANLPGRASISLSASWRSSQAVSGYYNTGYFWRSTGNTADGAYFGFRLDQPGCYAVDAWWAAGSDRSPTAPWFIFDSDGAELGYAEVDQRVNGGRWNELGAWTFSAGWASVALSRWAPAGDVVIADAVRVRPSSACAGAPDAPTTAPIDYVIDSNNAYNQGPFEVGHSEGWTTSAATPGYVGDGYLFHDTEAGTDPVSFWFWLDEAATIRVEARWTAGPNRSAAAPFVMLDGGDRLLGTVTVDQRRDHATWVDLGEYRFTAGWNRVALSHWAPEGAVVVADAVRVREIR